MKQKRLLQCTLMMFTVFFSLQSYAVKPFTVTCGDGEKIDVPDSAYNPASIALACLSAGHEPPRPYEKKPERKKSLKIKKTTGESKIFKARQLKQFVAANSGQQAANVDHSDIILMLQGCQCISPSCVAYQCPADVDIP